LKLPVFEWAASGVESVLSLMNQPIAISLRTLSLKSALTGWDRRKADAIIHASRWAISTLAQIELVSV
jgi:hypothetical protein